MQPNDLIQFGELLDAMWALKGAPAPTPMQKAMFFSALKEYPLDEVRAGLDAHLRDPKVGMYLPMPAHVIAQIQGFVADDGRPGPEEAWATAYRTSDDAATVVWTAETAEAYGAARPLVQAGDEVAARMAFKEVYVRLVAVAREQRVPPKWSVNLGFDNDQRNAALLAHVQAGRIGTDLMLDAPIKGFDGLLLPAPEGESETTKALRAQARAAMLAMREEDAERAAHRKGADEIERERTAALKAASASKVRNYASTSNTFNVTGTQS